MLVSRGLQGHPDLVDHRDLQVQQGLLAVLVLPDLVDLQALVAPADLLDQQEPLVLPVRVGQLVQQDRRDPPGQVAHQALQVQQVLQVHQDHRVRRGLQDLVGRVVPKVRRAHLGLQVLREQQDHLGLQALQGQLEQRVHLVQVVRLEVQDLPARVDHRELQVRRVLVGPQAPRVRLAHQVHRGQQGQV